MQDRGLLDRDDVGYLAVQFFEHHPYLTARQICAQHTTPAGYLPLIALSAKWEQNFAESIVGQGDDKSLAMQPSRLSEFITSVRERFEDAARQGEAPVLVTSPHIRPFVHPDQRAVAVGNPSTGAAQDGRQHLASRNLSHQRNVNRSWNPRPPSYVGTRNRRGWERTNVPREAGAGML